MRFQIGGGGLMVIVVGVAVLSGAVFALGMVAGYEMAKETQPDVNQISSTYPIPAPPPSDSNASASPAIAPVPSVAVPASSPSPSKMFAHASIAPSPASRPTIARIPASAATPEESADVSGDETASSPEAAASPEGSAHIGKPYNIQIEAVMDKSGADAMVSRLRALGYNASSYTQVLGGENWYRVRVGPYYSQSEAQEAESKLREQYRSAYSTRQ